MAKGNFVNEFKAFVERGSAIDMAVGIIVGSVMTSLVNSLVSDVLMPPIGLFIGGVDFSQFFIVLKGGAEGVHYMTAAAAQAAGATTMNIGIFLNAVVSFLITMFALFLILRISNKARGRQVSVTKTCPYCKSTINALAVRCPNCCSELPVVKSVKPKKEIKIVSKIERKIKKII